MMAVISVPPEVSLTQEVSVRRTRAWARSRAPRGVAVSRTNHWVRPAPAGSSSPTTRSDASSRSRL
jgi:hypothetical protein